MGFFLLRAFPFPCLGPLGHRAPLAAATATPRHRLFDTCAPTAYAVLGLLSGTSGKPPVWVLLPVLQSFKERGKLARLFRGRRPLRFLSSSYLSPGRCRTGCFSQVGGQSGLRKTIADGNSLAHRTTCLRSDFCSLCFRVSKNAGSWLASSEAAGP